MLYLDTLRPLAAEALERLSPGRREKALRLRREDKRLQSIGAGLLLRRFFGPGDPVIAPGGKPYYPGGRQFSLTHSGELAAIAVCDAPVGLDAEKIAPASEELCRRVLNERELLWLGGQGEEGFPFLWTRKEAALKCLGVGADRPLRSFCVLPDGPLALDGKAIHLHTVRQGEYILSAAGGDDVFFIPRVIGAEELLR